MRTRRLRGGLLLLDYQDDTVCSAIMVGDVDMSDLLIRSEVGDVWYALDLLSLAQHPCGNADALVQGVRADHWGSA